MRFADSAYLLLICGIIHAEKDEYPPVPLATIAAGKWYRPRAEVAGIVTLVKKEADGDYHIRLDAGTSFIVLEIIPELPLKTHPKVGDKIKGRGIVRFDGEHKWWELHPLTSWEPANGR